MRSLEFLVAASIAKTAERPARSYSPQTARRYGAARLALALILTLAGCGDDSSSPAPQPTPAPNGSFAPAASTPSMNMARQQATATLLPNGKVLIAGGVSDSPGSDLASIELYDSASNSLAPAASLPMMNEARVSATATLMPNGKVLIAGGANSTGGIFNTGVLNSVELYDPATSSFAPAASLPTMNQAREDAVSVLLSTGNVLIAGGEGPSPTPPFSNVVSLNSVELYDPATNSFAPAASLPTMNELRDTPIGTLLSNGKMLIAGGLEGFLVPEPLISKSVDLYDPLTNALAPAASLPTMNTSRLSATATLLPSGEVLIAGGETPTIGLGFAVVVLASVDLYDPVTNTFAPAGSLPTMNKSRQSATATLLNNGRVLIAGGGDNSNEVLASVDLYDPAANSFVPPASTPTMNQARHSATATLLPNGKVLIAGGEELSKTLASTELYTP
jgi:Galactose oxidase, central domain